MPDVTFDPALVAWEYAEGAYGTALVLRYGGDPIHRNACMDGMRPKYALIPEGVIVKAVLHDLRWLSGYRDQSATEWVVWNALPDEARYMFQPVVCHAWSRVEHDVRPLVVSWTAQEWCPGVNDVTRMEAATMTAIARTAGLEPQDDDWYQLRRRPDGTVVWLDYGSWYLDGEHSRSY